MQSPPVTTAEQLLTLHEPGVCHELVRGELRRMSPAGHWHGFVVATITRRLADHVSANELGAVYGAETGFLLERDPDTVRAPDVAFVRAERVPAPGPGYFPGPPDLAVEVRSPGDSTDKAGAWQRHGTTCVWVVDPIARTVTVHEANRGVVVLTAPEELHGGPLLPGFCVRVGDLFPVLPRHLQG